jgi:potassium-transporting ATPase KdpC subunit
MMKTLRTSVIAILSLTVLLGLIYPLVMTGISAALFPGNSHGSLIRVDGNVVGSKLIGQDFSGKPQYFQSRPSATGYAGDATFFSNAGPNSEDYKVELDKRAAVYLKREGRFDTGLTRSDIPSSALQTSASGIDPAIDPADARIQAHRVADERGLPLSRVLDLVNDNTQGRGLGVYGEPTVNVLQLNLDLDQEVAK